MSKAKHKVFTIEPGLSSQPESMLSRLGEFAEGGQFGKEFVYAFYWRWRTMLYEFVKQGTNPEIGEEDDRKLKEQIGEVVRAAVVRGDSAFLHRLATATDFANHSFQWRADNLSELADFLDWKDHTFCDPLRATIAFEYNNRHSGQPEELKKERRAFMPQIATKLGRVVDKAFERAFDKACKKLGIKWQRRVATPGARSRATAKKNEKPKPAKRSKPKAPRLRQKDFSLTND